MKQATIYDRNGAHGIETDPFFARRTPIVSLCLSLSLSSFEGEGRDDDFSYQRFDFQTDLSIYRPFRLSPLRGNRFSPPIFREANEMSEAIIPLLSKLIFERGIAVGKNNCN